MAVQFDDQNFEQEVLKSDVPVLVDFFAEWCGPCKMMSPTIDKLAQEYEGKVKIGKLDVDANQEMSSKYGVTSIPTLIYFKGGEIQGTPAPGFQSEEAIRQKLEELV